MDKKSLVNRGEADLISCPAAAIVNSSSWLGTLFNWRALSLRVLKKRSPSPA